MELSPSFPVSGNGRRPSRLGSAPLPAAAVAWR